MNALETYSKFYIVPVIGARTRAQLTETLTAIELTLEPAELDRMEAALPPTAVAGSRYPAQMMRMLDSED